MDPDNTRWKLWAEVVRLWLPVLISVCAISLTIFQATLARRHARLSVQPRLEWRVAQDDDAGTFALSLVNGGIGPAITSNVELVFDGRVLGPIGPETCEALDRALGHDGPDWETACVRLPSENVIRPGESMVIYGTRPDQSNTREQPLAPVVDLLPKIEARARYCSFYGECWQMPAP